MNSRSPSRHNKHTGMIYFIPASLLLHAILLTIWNEPEFDRHNTDQAITVSLLDLNDKTNNQVSSTTNIEKNPLAIQQESHHKQKVAIQVQAPLNPTITISEGLPITNSETVTTPPTVASIKSTDAATSPNNEKTISTKPAPTASKIRAVLYHALAHYFTYPQLARRRGWEGEVLLSFRIERDGHLQDIQVTKSSGYKLLDRSAVKALGKVTRIPWQDSNTIDMQLPVVYQLHEG
jgi:protein TonB